MSTITFDSALGVQNLRRSGFTEEQAQAIVQTLREAQAELATKGDLLALRLELKSDMQIMARDLKLWTGKITTAGVAFLTVIIGLAAAAQHFWK